MHLGEKLKLYRKSKDLSQPQMADVLGIAYRTYQEIERTGIITKAAVASKVQDILKDNTQKNADDAQKKSPKEELEQVLPMGDLRLTVADYIKKMDEHAKKIERTNEFLQKMLSEKTSEIDKNLNRTLAYAGRIDLQVEAASEIAMESLERLEKKPKGSLAAEVGKAKARRLKELRKQGN